jgi:hypothetical protein
MHLFKLNDGFMALLLQIINGDSYQIDIGM